MKTKNVFNVFAIVLASMPALPAMAALTCEEIQVNGETNIEYFKENEKPRGTAKFRKQLIRAAVSDKYGECGKTWNDDFCYRPNMTDVEVDELGENVGFVGYTSPNGEEYYGVNVGYGGGNSAVYFFPSDTLEMEKIMITDGYDCEPIQSLQGYE